MTEIAHCHKPLCQWISRDNISSLPPELVPKLLPNPELSGIGVILGFSITAYLTFALLILHYFIVHDPHRIGPRGTAYTNAVDRDFLAYFRGFISWTPSRRFEYAMEKSVLILSDLQLVTGLAILVSGYSQLNCGLTAYHWQIMVYVAWFSSFTFLSAMTFLEGYFQENHTMRIIRVCFMFVLASLLIVALLPTGSHNWLNLLSEGEFYPSLPAACYFRQLPLDSYSHGGPKIWSMVVSILVVAISYIHSGIRLFDPTAEFTRKHFRAWPALHIKRALNFFEQGSRQGGIRAALWKVLFLVAFAMFTCSRAFLDLAESMLLEIVWLGFAIAWGTIKLYGTRATASYDVDGFNVGANPEVLQEDSWSFGQTLPLILLVLPLLSMAQAYLDNDAKAQDAAHKAAMAERLTKEREANATPPPRVSIQHVSDGDVSKDNDGLDRRTPTTWDIPRCDHHSSLRQAPSKVGTNAAPPLPPRSSRRISSFFEDSPKLSSSPQLPSYPYHPFNAYPWYKDAILLLFLQILMIAAFAPYLLNRVSDFLGISVFLRNRLFLIWVLGVIPWASLLHLTFWYLAAWIVRAMGVSLGKYTFWVLRMGLVAGLLAFTFLVSFELAGPNWLFDAF
ncbi:hypothetical protein BDV96DRAFT_601462 [Lophiotrema nucula]|uniref:Uncharacterized protein n=1 Tax=Lophiotrema nucula TaxID=690887 RepID=A0A6A5Z2K2_9PLEO|nr:hypothetical protein BDV96DRAFT_601462 [Lophiotrema nucula]